MECRKKGLLSTEVNLALGISFALSAAVFFFTSPCLPPKLWRQLFDTVVTEVEVQQLCRTHEKAERNVREVVVAQIQNYVL